MESGLEGRNNLTRGFTYFSTVELWVSMESGLEGRNNPDEHYTPLKAYYASQWSPA